MTGITSSFYLRANYHKAAQPVIHIRIGIGSYFAYDPSKKPIADRDTDSERHPHIHP
jgi:hypothetical protein